jgi:hypothetical protein
VDRIPASGNDRNVEHFRSRLSDFTHWLHRDHEYRARLPTPRLRGAALAALLHWMRSTGIGRIDLHASPDGDVLYRSVGFTDPQRPGFTLHR